MAGKKKILIVEDNRPLSKAMKLQLEKDGFAVKQAFDGKEALNMVNVENFDLFVVDLIMPEVDGFTFISEMKKQDVKTPIMVVSNLGGDENGNKKIKSMVDTYLIKSDISLEDVAVNAKRLIAG